MAEIINDFPLQIQINGTVVPCSRCHTLILGSGAASLAAAVRLRRGGLKDICIVTDNLLNGTSRNTGSDKQTYYKLSDASDVPDSPYLMARSLAGGGAMHGDIALIEAIGSTSAFYNLVSIGVPFPFNQWGGYTGYKTDHDDSQRGVSLGPYTSKLMVEYLERECRTLGIPILDKHDCVQLIKTQNRIAGAVVLDKVSSAACEEPRIKVLFCENMVFGLGGPGGMFAASAYPPHHTGGIGLALEIGAEAVNLTESQFGIASVKFRWNLSGSYQQVIPDYYSVDPGTGQKYSFLNDYFPDMRTLSEAVFLKGYQWPFDPEKIGNHGSSLIDILVNREIEQKGRKVYMDFRHNLAGDSRIGDFDSVDMGKESLYYWKQSELDAETPYLRLMQLNPRAADLYREHNIDLAAEPLEVAVCAQHNNGGLAGDSWWESTNIGHFFPIGEVNGSHGVARPGGTALNSGQVGALRASQRIIHCYAGSSLDVDGAVISAGKAVSRVLGSIDNLLTSEAPAIDALAYQREIQERMTSFAALLRDRNCLQRAVSDARDQLRRFAQVRVRYQRLSLALKLRHIAVAQYMYLVSILDYVESGGGSRGSYIVHSRDGISVHPLLDSELMMSPDEPGMRNKIQALCWNGKTEEVEISWRDIRPIPEEKSWFETVWSRFRDGTVFYPNRG